MNSDSIASCTTRGVTLLRGDDSTFLVPALTILAHPDGTRVGEVALLKDASLSGKAELSRLLPLFGPLGKTAEIPLADRFVSRKSVDLVFDPGGGVSVTAQAGAGAEVEGVPLVETRTFNRQAFVDGIVIVLAQRVCVLLHLLALPFHRGPSLGLVGGSDAMEAVRRDIQRVADLDVPVLIRGETGTGKELVAKAIVGQGPRREKPFIAVNMAALPGATAASELFGHCKGAFTGAVTERVGFFVEAHTGTLFLDELGLMPAEVQSMLLRSLETREVQPMGGGRARKVNVRFVAATDSDLARAIAAGAFSEALLHRLAGYEISLPSLRARRDDIGRLLVTFLREELAILGEGFRMDLVSDDRSPWLPATLVARLARHDWPGNVRQLRNVARQMAIGSRGESVSAQVKIDGALERMLSESKASVAAEAIPQSESEADRIQRALDANAGNQSRAAKDLGISRTTLVTRIKSFGLARPRK